MRYCYTLLLLAFALCFGGCLDVQTDGPALAPTPEPLTPRLSFYPAEAMPGQAVTATIEGIHTEFVTGTTATLGEGVVVNDVIIRSPYVLDLDLQVDPAAVVGYRQLALNIPGQGEVTLGEALLIQKGQIFVSPSASDRGKSIVVTLRAVGVALRSGSSWVDFGDGIVTESFQIIEEEGETYAEALIRIESDAVPGPRDVTLSDGPSRVRLAEGFTVGRGLVAVSVEPKVVSQGETEVTFTITGYNTHFEQGRTQLDFGIGFFVDDEDPTALVVEGPERIKAKVKVCRAAIPGLHTLTVQTLADAGPLEIVRGEDPIEVVAVPGTVAEGYGSFNLSLSRSFTPTGIEETVNASGVFNVVSGGCEPSNGTGCGVSTPPYDQPVFYPPAGCEPESSTVVNPPSPSLDAGPSIFLEANNGAVVIRLDKNQDSDGTLFYGRSAPIPKEDFLFNTAYSVRIPGGTGESAVPETILKDVILTPPSDYYVREPDLSLAPTINPYDALFARWEDQNGNPGTGNFPVASLSITVRTNAATTGALSQISQIPLDDGEFSIPAEFISQLYPGAGLMIFSLTRIGPVYSLPGSGYRSYATSNVSYSGLLEVRE